MTTEERIEVMEECARLVRCVHVTAINDEIACLRRTLEPPTAEEWAEQARTLLEFCAPQGLNMGTWELFRINWWREAGELQKLLDHRDGAKGVK